MSNKKIFVVTNHDYEGFCMELCKNVKTRSCAENIYT